MWGTLYKLGEVHFRLLGFWWKDKEWKIYCCGLGLSAKPQIWNFHVLIWQIRHKIASESVPHVQHDYFSLLNQSNHWFLALQLPLPSSNFQLPNKVSNGFTGESKVKGKLSNLIFSFFLRFGLLLDWQVCCFGAVGFLCWIMHAAIAGYWAVTAEYRHDIKNRSYATWDSVKFGVRGLSTAFIMYLFSKVNAQAFPRQNPGVKSNYFVVPVIMFGILSTFIETLVDQYVGAVDSAIRFVLMTTII